jgi:WD40 repeat protein
MILPRTFLVGFVFSAVLLSQSALIETQRAVAPFPSPDYVFGGDAQKPGKNKVVLGHDKNGNATFTVYNGPAGVQVSSLSFSTDGRILAVGSTPGRIDLWDVEAQKKLRTISGSSTMGLSFDGRLLATEGKNGNGIVLYDVRSGRLQRQMTRILKRAENVVEKFSFSPDGTLLDVTANGDDDAVYEVSSGKLLVTLTNTKHAEFSKDGSLLIGANYEHLVVWRTNDWTKVRDLSNGPDYVTYMAVAPEQDFVIVGGPKIASLRRLTSGEKIAEVGAGYTHYAAFIGGDLIFTYSSGTGFGIWDLSGRLYCSRGDLKVGTVGASGNSEWLASATANPGTSVMIWNLRKSIAACGVAVSGRKP